MTHDEIIQKYETIKNTTQRFSHWSEMDHFIKEVAQQVSLREKLPQWTTDGLKPRDEVKLERVFELE